MVPQIKVKFWLQIVIIVLHIFLKHFQKPEFFYRSEIPTFWLFGPILTPISPLKMAEIKKVNIFIAKSFSVRLSKSFNIKDFLLSIFNENYTYLFLYSGFFHYRGPRIKNLEVIFYVSTLLDETHLDLLGGLSNRDVLPSASTRTARRSNTTTFDKDKQIFSMLMPRTWFKVEEFILEYPPYL